MNSNELKQELILEAKKNESYVIKTQHKLHMHPETGFEEEKTAKFIEEELNKIGCKTERIAKTGVIATIRGGQEGQTVALRADMDALNVSEENDIPYRSIYPGKMHACGHDAHVAMLLGGAKVILKYKEHLQGDLKLIFQPAEEGGGGAKKIIETGRFKGTDFVFGLHVWHSLPSGIIATRKGPTFGSSDRFILTVRGKGGHDAVPHQAIDPTSVVVDIYNAIQKLFSREIDPFESRVLTVPVIKGSNEHNVIPSNSVLRGTLRTLNETVRKYTINRIQEIAEGYSEAWRCTSTIKFNPINYPPVVNDDIVVDEIMNILQSLDKVRIMNQTLVGEDFAYFLQKAKGAFLTLGIYNEDKGIIHPHHHPKFQVDESVLWKGTAIYSLLGFYSLFKRA